MGITATTGSSEQRVSLDRGGSMRIKNALEVYIKLASCIPFSVEAHPDRFEVTSGVRRVCVSFHGNVNESTVETAAKDIIRELEDV